MLLESYVKVIDVLGSFFDISSMGFYTTMHWQTSSRLVQELDVCTVPFESKLRSFVRSSMHPCPGNSVAIGQAVVYYDQAARA